MNIGQSIEDYENWRDRQYDCEVCGNPFVPNHPRQKYCKGCAESVNRRKTRDRMYNSRNPL